MLLKRYRGISVRDALAQVRGDLGPDALVLATRLVPDDGWRGLLGRRVVELTATPKANLSKSRPSAQPAGVAQDEIPTGRPDVAPAASSLTNATAVADRASEPGRDDRAIESLVARLCAAGLDRALAADVARTIPRVRRRFPTVALLRRAIADRLAQVVAADDAYERAEVFIGPPGVGKTTTIAKIAAQERARRGTRLGLVAADGFRVGAVEQLRLYAGIIGAPFSVARTVEEVDAVLSGRKPHPVLVDTAGRAAHDTSSAQLLEHLANRPGVRVHLVLSASTPAADANRVIDAYAAARPHRLVLTRVDEATSIAPLLAVVRDRGLPLSYLGLGQRVPEDLARATAPVVAAHLLGEPANPVGDRR